MPCGSVSPTSCAFDSKSDNPGVLRSNCIDALARQLRQPARAAR
jgi:hypothetical protein